MSIQKSEIQLDVNGQLVNAYLVSLAGGGSGVLVLHAWWGLKPFFKQVCDQLAEHGYMALAPDLYQGQIANTIDEAKALRGPIEEGGSDLMEATVLAAKDHLLGLTKNKIGVIGFSMGAAWSLVVASADPNKVAATGLFYGTYSGMDFSKMKSKIIGHFAEDDEWEPLDEVKAMGQSMKDAGLDVTFHFYPKVGHWFVESDRPEYDSAAASLAWERTFEFLKKNL